MKILLLFFDLKRIKIGRGIQMSEVIILACITSDGGLDNDGNYIIPKQDYLKWVGEKLEQLDGVLVMGNKTYQEEHYGEILNEDIVVMSRDGCTREDLKSKESVNKIILGGQEVYEEFIEDATRIILLEVACVLSTDKYLPEFDVEKFKVVGMEDVEGKRFYGVEKQYERVWDEEELI